jgi:uncharacterized protein (TIGR00299 family) protein
MKADTTLIFVDPVGGLAGDMMLAALLDAGADEALLASLPERLGMKDVVITHGMVRRGGFRGEHVEIGFDEAAHPHSRTLPQVEAIIDAAELDEPVRDRAKRVFRTLAKAEAAVHGHPIDKVHFHEVGAVDAICDIVGSCELLAQLAPSEIVCGPLPMGHGFVTGAHGQIPLPAPAVAELLDGIPVYDAQVEGETVTPTGMALLKTLATRFAAMPPMTVQKIGIGAGSKDFPRRANLLRLFCGKGIAQEASREEELLQLACTIDDMEPRLLAYVIERVHQVGALEAFVTPVVMKKGRPAHLLSVLCEPTMAPTIEGLIFAETTTLGLRRAPVSRSRLDRRSEQVSTRYGEVEVKVAMRGEQALRCTPEYDSCAALAQAADVPVQEVIAAAAQAWRESRS